MQKETWWQQAARAVTLKRLVFIWVGLAVFSGGVLVGQRWQGGSADYASRTGLPQKFDYSQVDTVYQSLRDNYDGKLTEAAGAEWAETRLGHQYKRPVHRVFYR
jgi:hypothetical protein